MNVLATFTEWPRHVHNPRTGQWRVFKSMAEIPPDWIAAIKAGPLDPLDHDGDGVRGGSPRPEGDDLPALRAEYQSLVGKRPFMGWAADELRRRIAEAAG